MNLQTKTALKFAAAAGMAAVAVFFVASHLNGVRKTGEEGAMSWFYDESEKRLYKVPRDTIPPAKGIGGPAGDGVRAVVVAIGAAQTNPSKLRIAYLETYTPSLKRILEGVHAAHVALRKFEGQIPPRDSKYYQDNTLVRRENDADWYPASSVSGRQVMSEWRSWRDPAGQRPVVCVP